MLEQPTTGREYFVDHNTRSTTYDDPRQQGTPVPISRVRSFGAVGRSSLTNSLTKDHVHHALTPSLPSPTFSHEQSSLKLLSITTVEFVERITTLKHYGNLMFERCHATVLTVAFTIIDDQIDILCEKNMLVESSEKRKLFQAKDMLLKGRSSSSS